jgi:hypothetical protein
VLQTGANVRIKNQLRCLISVMRTNWSGNNRHCIKYTFLNVEITSILPQKSLYALPHCVTGVNPKASLQKELDEELAKHKGNEDEIKRLEKQHKKGTDEVHVPTSFPKCLPRSDKPPGP